MSTVVETDDFTVKHGIFYADIGSNAVTEVAEGFVDVTLTGDEPDIAINDVAQATEAIKLQFEKPIRVRERSRQGGEDHWLEGWEISHVENFTQFFTPPTNRSGILWS
jgi:hypothetical protein